VAHCGEHRQASGVAKPSKILTWPAPLVCRLNPADDARTVAHLKVATNKQLLGLLNSFLIIVTGDDLWWSRDAIAGEQRVNPIMRHGVFPVSGGSIIELSATDA
jgi:hypothetical protein